MRQFRAGEFKRQNMGGFLRRLSPVSSSLSILDIKPSHLAGLGKKLVLIDVDNTIVPWRSEEIPDSSRQWIDGAKAAGLKLRILSNTRNPKRLERIAERLGVGYLRGKFKPSREMYLQALSEEGVEAEQAIMIGDQLFTDVLGANRSGIDAIWVRPMTSRDFIGTKVSRLGELFARWALYRHLHTPEMVSEAEELGLPATSFRAQSLLRHPVIGQFAKFVVVGGTSMVIDLGLHFTLMWVIPVGDEKLGPYLGKWLLDEMPGLFAFARDAPAAAFPVLKIPAASIAILNSFIWNRRWTFGIVGQEGRMNQLQKFVLVSVIGMGINTTVGTLFNNIIPLHPRRSWAIASAIATVVTAFWNFAGQKFFAFKPRKR